MIIVIILGMLFTGVVSDEFGQHQMKQDILTDTKEQYISCLESRKNCDDLKNQIELIESKITNFDKTK